MKRQGKPSWTWKVAPPRLMQVRLAIESERETAREIYLRLDLQRFTRYETFRRWMSGQRRVNAGRESNTSLVVRSQANAAAVDAPRFRGRWGTRGIARLRKLGLAALDGPEASAVAWASLLDAADSLRIIADKLADVARLFGPCQEGQSATSSDRTRDGDSGADHEVGS